MGRHLASTSTVPNPCCLSPANVMPPNPLYLLTSLSDGMACASLAAPSALHQLVKRCCRPGSTRSRGVWVCCMNWRCTAGDHPIAFLPSTSQALLHPANVHITKATSEFDAAMRESLEAILGGPISDWSWLKASLPSSCGGVNLRNAAKHAPAAFIASSGQSRGLVEKILAQPPDLLPHLDLAASALATDASQPDWQQLEVIDVPLRQHHLSQAIDESVNQQLLSSASSPRGR